MSSALETLLEAARFIELQEQREQRLTSTSSSSSLSTSPYSNSRYPNSTQCGQQLIASPPTSPVTSSDGIHNRHHLLQNNDFGGSTIIRTGKFSKHIIYVSAIIIIFHFLLLLLYEFWPKNFCNLRYCSTSLCHYISSSKCLALRRVVNFLHGHPVRDATSIVSSSLNHNQNPILLLVSPFASSTSYAIL